MPYLGLGGDHVGGDAGERYRQLEEVPVAVETHCERTDYVGYVLALEEAGRQQAVLVGGKGPADGRDELVGAGIGPALHGQFEPGRVVVHHLVPIHPGHDGLELRAVVSAGIKAAHESAYAGSDHEVHRNAAPLDFLDHADVRSSLGTAAAEHERNGGTLFPNHGHTFAHAAERGSIPLGIHTIRILLRERAHGGEEEQRESRRNDLSHAFRVFL